jgi:hypothetical protein
MRYHRGLLFWGLALITGGAVALAAQQGYLDRTWLAGAWRLWPLILVAIGLSILLARTPAAIIGTIVAALVVGTAGGALIAVGPGAFSCGGADPTNLTTRQGTLHDDANVELNFNCGTLRVGMADAAGWTVASGETGGSPATISADSDLLGVRSPTDSWFDHGRQRWDVTLPRVTSYHLLEIQPNAAETSVELAGGTFAIVSVHPNAGSLFLDLTDASVRQLGMSLNAGSASILIGPELAMTASLSVNAGSIDLCTTGDVALRVSSDSNLTFSTNLDETNLVKSGHTWSTAGYDAASAQVSIDLSGNAGSFTLNPEGGCS